ncbi:MAG: NADH-quinone oxidoreductase subunit G, partial [Campylobacter sp.]|nr:NADH-quinone oxidoreductase subunit G [Campylobacter sp.]
SKFAKMLGLDEAKVSEILAKKEKFSLIVGEDFIFSKNAKTLAKLAGLIQKFTPFKILIIPPRTNSLGVSLICDLDKDTKGKVLGYNENGDITMGVLKGDLDMPSLIQQEGTFTNYDKRVVPTNAALSYDGFELNDIANALGIKSEFTIDYTPNLGVNFKNIKFDDLENFYDNGGVNHRGYELESKIYEAKTDEFEITNLNETLNLNENEVQIYKANPIHQFSKFTNAATQLNEVANLIVGSEFLAKFEVNDGEVVTLKKGEFALAIAVKLDKNLQGAILPYFDEKIEFDKFFENGRYSVVSVEKAKV